ncbi:hypothetical protein ACJX0J_018320, partial [Zea mays]
CTVVGVERISETVGVDVWGFRHFLFKKIQLTTLYVASKEKEKYGMTYRYACTAPLDKTLTFSGGGRIDMIPPFEQPITALHAHFVATSIDWIFVYYINMFNKFLEKG